MCRRLIKVEKKWEELSSDEKQEERFESWLSPQGVEFASPEAEKSYRERVTRIKDAIQLKKVPDRVPVFPFVDFFPALYAGITYEEAMYNYDKLNMAWKKYILDFEPDVYPSLIIPGPGKFLEILDCKAFIWPGHGISPNHPHQWLETEYVTANEYDALIHDPSYFFTSTYLPRICGALEPLRKLLPPIGMCGLRSLNQYGMPDVQSAYKALFEASSEAMKWAGLVDAWIKEMAAAGFPNFFGGIIEPAGIIEPPFDRIGNWFRGAKGIILDMYRQPNKLLEALEAITPTIIKQGVSASNISGRPTLFVPLCKGDDSLLSEEQYKTFYWPTLRKVIMGLIDEGCVPFLMAHGAYNSRLEIIRDLPKGKVIWVFDLADMAKAKETLGDTACIGGNMPIALLTVGTAQEVKDYAKKLIDTCGKGGGYIMACGAGIIEAKPENVKAMIDFTKEYGVYK
jgi:hypothetical protein